MQLCGCLQHTKNSLRSSPFTPPPLPLCCQLAYCENDVECRRTLQLAHLDEKFVRDKCGGTCDTCERGVVAEERDATALAKVIVRTVLHQYSSLLMH